LLQRLERLEWFVTIKKLKFGDSFGELAFINDAPRSATITAAEFSEFAIIYRNDYERVIKKVEAR
jgi:CRP-like cAMP-binding protein